MYFTLLIYIMHRLTEKYIVISFFYLFIYLFILKGWRNGLQYGG